MRGFLIGESLMNICIRVGDVMKKTDIIIATKSCKGCPFKLHADRSSYCQAETLFPSSYLLCGGYISYPHRGHDFNKLFIIL